jgi:hypothetical protein
METKSQYNLNVKSQVLNAKILKIAFHLHRPETMSLCPHVISTTRNNTIQSRKTASLKNAQNGEIENVAGL